MGSFVPLGGFFPTPSEFKNLLSSTNQSTRCDLCNEKYEQEVSTVLKGGSNTSVADQYSKSLPSWLQMTECDSSKRVDVVKVCTTKIKIMTFLTTRTNTNTWIYTERHKRYRPHIVFSLFNLLKIFG